MALFVGLILVWGWVAGPALALLLVKLGMCTRNISAIFVAYFSFTQPDPGILVMIVLLIPLTILIGFAAARIFAKGAMAATVATGNAR